MKQLQSIQYLRAIAALMVVMVHLSNYGPGMKEFTGRFPAGVDIFFVISGFIMVVTSRRATPISFMGRRIARIVPLYWALTLALFAVGLHAHKHSVGELVKSLAFIPFVNPHQNGEMLPLIGPGWSLNVEMYFYVLFALSLFARRWSVLIIGVLFAALVSLAPMVHNQVAAFYMQPRLIEFWAGMAIGWAYLKGMLKAGPLVSVAAIVVGFATLVAGPLPYQIPATLIILGAVCLEAHGLVPRWRPLAYLGDASYSLYLTHAAVIEGLYQVWKHLHVGGFPLVGFTAAIVGGLVCYRYLETPLSNARQRMSQKEALLAPLPEAS